MEGFDYVFREENGSATVIGWVVKRVVDRMNVREKNGPWRALEEVMSDPSLDDKEGKSETMAGKGRLGLYSNLYENHFRLFNRIVDAEDK